MKHLGRLITVAAVGAALGAGASKSSLARQGTKDSDAAAPATQPAQPVSVVLVHGAFADGSSWNKVIPALQEQRLNVVSVQNPLTSLNDDVAATRRVLDAQRGPVVLVAHSWGGTVITQVGTHDKVKALVYVAAFAPSEGQSTSDLGKDYPTSPGLARVVQDSSGFLRLPNDAVAQDFAPDVPRAESNLIAVTQGTIRGSAFDEKVTAAAWRSRPSFYVLATKDRMIDPAQQRAMAKKVRATTRELPSSHVPMVSHPREVAEVIVSAARQVTPAR